MGFRFRRSVKLFPGVRVNFSKSGISLTAGVKGASLSLGNRGLYANAGIPGTGLYMREKLSGGGRKKPLASAPKTRAGESTDSFHEGRLDDFDRYEKTVLSLLNIHQTTGKPNSLPEMKEDFFSQFDKKEDPYKDVNNEKQVAILGVALAIGVLISAIIYTSSPYIIAAVVFLMTMLYNYRRKTFEIKEKREIIAAQQIKEAQAREEERENREIFNALMHGEDREAALGAALEALTWPHETLVDFEIKKDVIYLDIDLPEVEDWPTKKVVRLKTMVRLEDKSDSQIKKEYARYVHGIGFRTAGESFRAIPEASAVIMSAYTQRPETSTGQVTDQYIYSVRIPRSDWENIAFNSLSNVDPVAALDRFGMHKKMSKTGVFKTIEPLQ